ncbi:MAG: riboflavin synthase subunit alpha [Deltaproteobacteria bacterium GWC2_56_8]|nr:MAG: riboflavin synthase subunit alpha [Deltaproteobacteria bacterium GWB2_55_19]OGP37574.1 MAG: riboflavin synthase subunit alpha [Deltaproteobacteria bacterium GWC2_56_8]
MFTGIIEDVGRVKSIEKKGAFGRITIETALSLDEVSLGDSIAINGACLTVAGKSAGAFTADLSEETFAGTTLGELQAGVRVNLERALTLSKPLGGHMVTGHVDGIGRILKKTPKGGAMDIEVEIPDTLMGQVVRKGSIAIDGISLTIAEITCRSIRAAIIPHTFNKTTLLDKPEGAKVNIETDVIGKYVERYLSSGKKGMTEDFLAEHGFLKK